MLVQAIGSLIYIKCYPHDHLLLMRIKYIMYKVQGSLQQSCSPSYIRWLVFYSLMETLAYLQHFTIGGLAYKSSLSCHFLLKCLYQARKVSVYAFFLSICITGIYSASFYELSTGFWNCSDSVVFVLHIYLSNKLNR